MRYLAQTAILAALTAVGALVTVPLGPVPFTLQSLVVPLAGALLGAAGGFLSQVVYLLLGFVGLPVFAGFTSGIGMLATPTGGFLLSFPLAAAVAGWLTGPRGFRPGAGAPAASGPRSSTPLSFWRVFTAMVVADAVVFLIGVPWLAYAIGPAHGGPLDLVKAARLGFLPFAATDLLKLVVAAFLAIRLRAALGRTLQG